MNELYVYIRRTETLGQGTRATTSYIYIYMFYTHTQKTNTLAQGEDDLIFTSIYGGRNELRWKHSVNLETLGSGFQPADLADPE